MAYQDGSKEKLMEVMGDELSHYTDYKQGKLRAEHQSNNSQTDVSRQYGDNAAKQTVRYVGDETFANADGFKDQLSNLDFSEANQEVANTEGMEHRNFQYVFREAYYKDTGRSADEDFELIGDPARPLRQGHYSRNMYNDPSLATDEMPQDKNVFHTQGPNGEGNRKYISPDGHHEGVYDANGNLVTDPLNMGTYNFASPDKWARHGLKDVAPYLIWGNTPDDSSTGFDRTMLLVGQGVKNLMPKKEDNAANKK